jgi:hypothetical protein
VLVDQVERQQRVAQVVEHAHEEHEVEALAERADVVDRELAELDVDGPCTSAAKRAWAR